MGIVYPGTLQHRAELLPHNATITEAADHYIEHVLVYRPARPLSARRRIKCAVKLSQLWNYAIANGWGENNVPASIPRPNAEDGEQAIFTLELAAGAAR